MAIFFHNNAKRRSGQSTVEYILIMGLVVAAATLMKYGVVTGMKPILAQRKTEITERAPIGGPNKNKYTDYYNPKGGAEVRVQK